MVGRLAGSAAGFLGLLVLALPAWADGIQTTYPYFYPCASGIVDCTSFSVHDYAYTGPLQWISENGTRYGNFHPDAVNASGEAIGTILLGGGDDGEIDVGYATSTSIRDMGDIQGAHPIDINNDGLYIFNFTFDLGPIIGKGGSIGNVSGPGGTTYILVHALNDSDQILADVLGVEGVLSTTPIVPEPSSIALVLTAIGIVGLKVRQHRCGSGGAKRLYPNQ